MQEAPCSIESAINNNGTTGTQVLLQGGDYGSAGAPTTNVLHSGAPIAISPIPGTGRPRIFITGSAAPIWLEEGASMTDVDIRSSALDSPALILQSAYIDRVSVHATNHRACSFEGDFSVRNSLCATSAPGQTAVEANADSVTSLGQIRHMTAWSATGAGLSAAASPGTTLRLHINSSILHGGTSDLSGSVFPGSGATVDININHSNYAKFVGGTGVTNSSLGIARNQTDAPLLTNPAAFDFTQAVGSPTVDGGEFSVSSNPTDLAGNVRFQGRTTDIGAFESTPVQSVITAFTLNPSKFRAEVGGEIVSIAKKKKKPKAPMGSTLAMTINQASSVKFTIEQPKIGRKSKGTCKPITRSNRKRKPCTRWAGVPGFFWVQVKTGLTTFKLSGRAKEKALRPGKYRVKATPVNTPLPAGVPAYARFTIVR